jgi:hypothetical protein
MQRGFGAGCKGVRAALGKSATTFLIDNEDGRSRVQANCVGMRPIHGASIELALKLGLKGNMVMTLTSFDSYAFLRGALDLSLRSQ